MKKTERRLRELILKTNNTVSKESELPNSTNFFLDNGYDYEEMVNLLFNVEKEWAIEINVSDYISEKVDSEKGQISFKINTFQELVDLIESKHELTVNSFKRMLKSVSDETLNDPNFENMPLKNLGISEKRLKLIIGGNFYYYPYCCIDIDLEQSIKGFIEGSSSIIDLRKRTYESSGYFLSHPSFIF